MKIGVVGSRSFKDYELLEKLLKDLSPSKIVSGGASGADKFAEIFAVQNCIPLEVYKPNWRLGRHAGLIRNSQIIENCDYLLAFWDGKSRGTKDSIDKALRKNLTVNVVRF